MNTHRFSRCVLFAFLILCLAAGLLPGASDTNPRLIVLLTVDQFRYDYLTRFLHLYTGGFRTLWDRGAVFTNAHLQHVPTATAVGHATLLTGATPSFSGVVGNEWYDRETKRFIASIFDPSVKLLGAVKGSGASPARLVVSTVGDELKMSGKGPSKVIGISLKDRGAILPAGRMADGAFWFDANSGNMISSTFYFADLPSWVKEFNGQRLVEKHLGAEWKSTGGKALRTLPAKAGPGYYDAFERSPYATDMLLAFAERAIDVEKLGADPYTDILSVSLSSTDLLGHTVGPDSEEIRELNLQTDRSLGRFLQSLEKRLGPGAVLYVFTADHGVAPLPETQATRRMPGGRYTASGLRKAVEAALTERFGSGDWIEFASDGNFWLNRAAIRSRSLSQSAVEEVAAGVLQALPDVFRVYTGSRIRSGQLVIDEVGRRVAASYFPNRSADVITIMAPYWIFSSSGTSHGTPFSYDTHLPLIFMGPGIKPGLYDQKASINDIAPTLATLLAVETPSGSSGRVLTEMLDQPRQPAPRRAPGVVKK